MPAATAAPASLFLWCRRGLWTWWWPPWPPRHPWRGPASAIVTAGSRRAPDKATARMRLAAFDLREVVLAAVVILVFLCFVEVCVDPMRRLWQRATERVLRPAFIWRSCSGRLSRDARPGYQLVRGEGLNRTRSHTSIGRRNGLPERALRNDKTRCRWRQEGRAAAN